MTIAFRTDVSRYFFDTEFIEDGQTIDLLSLALVPDGDGPELYICNAQADLSRASDWVRANVLPHLPPRDDARWMSRREMRNALVDYLGVVDSVHHPGKAPYPELWGYYSATDWVALYQLFGPMVALPKGMPRYCMDLKQLSVLLGSPANPPHDKARVHDALYDARWNRALFRSLRAAAGQP